MKYLSNSCIFIQENTFEKVVCKMTAILFQPQCVNGWCFDWSHGVLIVLRYQIWIFKTSLSQQMPWCLQAPCHLLSQWYPDITNAPTCLRLIWYLLSELMTWAVSCISIPASFITGSLHMQIKDSPTTPCRTMRYVKHKVFIYCYNFFSHKSVVMWLIFFL